MFHWAFLGLWRGKSRPLPSRRVALRLEPLECRMALSAPAPTFPATETFFPRIVNGRIVTPETNAGFPAVGRVGDAGGYFCTGTLVEDNHVLTAGHCAQGLRGGGARFLANGQEYRSTEIFVHPRFNQSALGTDAANDLAILRLDRVVEGVTPIPLSREPPLVGQRVILVGFGAGGSPRGGQDGIQGTKRSGFNTLSAVTSRLIVWMFDDETESNTAPGDSGGPAFIDVAGTLILAGVTSGGDRFDAALGDRAFDTRVDAYVGWIEATIGATPSPPPVVETDDHGNLPKTATTLQPQLDGRFVAAGKLTPTTDVDVFRIVANQAGRLTVRVLPASAGLDPVVTVFNARGKRIFQGAGDPPVYFRAVRGQVYYVAVSAVPPTAGDYELTIAGRFRGFTSPRFAVTGTRELARIGHG